GTPTYIYSLRRAVANLRRIQAAFAPLNAQIHYSAKANANLTVLRTLIAAGAGIDAVSGGEIHRALHAGATPEAIVFAGVGKTGGELFYALEHDIGWFNVENVTECHFLDAIAGEFDRRARVALRLNPDVAADTHPAIATGHGGAKFGLSAAALRGLLSDQTAFPHLAFAGVHLHIGSQLRDVTATVRAVQIARDLIAPYPQIRAINIGGGFPVAYTPDDELPPLDHFVSELVPLLNGYIVMLEPGRSIIADAGMLVTRVLYVKRQGGRTFVIVDAGMTELLRPALYGADHRVVPLQRADDSSTAPVELVGPVCESTDVLAHHIDLPEVAPGDLLAILTTGAYGMVMASNYNARPRPPEIVVAEDGQSWHWARHRESWHDLLGSELELLER
ncbi:MAG: diaminopimelate decarboxylase, partial [Chloroflexi bacterium]|nr:diaminopimelate decarboxylase [Chloroflexota bacterium]